MQSTVPTVVFPVAGLGTRILPAPKPLPKELLPLVDRPVIQCGVEEAVASGIDRVVLVTSPNNAMTAAHFEANPRLEDLLEEIVGEIRDEYDVESEPIVSEGEGCFVFAGTVAVDDAAERLQVDIERQGFETVGGYLLARLGRVPRVGEQLHVDDLQVEVLEGERRRVQRVRIRRQVTSGLHQ